MKVSQWVRADINSSHFTKDLHTRWIFTSLQAFPESSFHERCLNKLCRMQSPPYEIAFFFFFLPSWNYLGSPNNRVQKENSWKIQQSGLTWDALSPHSQCSIRRFCLAGGFSVGTLICKGTMKGLVNFHPVSNVVKIFQWTAILLPERGDMIQQKGSVDLGPDLGLAIGQGQVI